MNKLNILIKIAKIALILALVFGLSWGVCLFHATSDTDPNVIEKAIAEATKDIQDDLKEAEDKAKEAKAELKEAKAELKETKLELKEVRATKSSSSDSAISKPSLASKEDNSNIYKKIFEAIFYDVEGDFVMKDSEFKFYSDISCAPEYLVTHDLTFSTPRDLDARNASGFEVFISRSTKGPVFSTEKPYFDYK